MHARRVSFALIVLVAVAACSGAPGSKDADTKDDKSTLPTVSAGTILSDALTGARCARNAKGGWLADGTVKNTTTAKIDLEVRIHVGLADGKSGPAHVKLVRGLKPGASAAWSVLNVTADDAKTGPCHIQVAVAK